MKDPLPTLKQRNAVYHILCFDCSNVGRTGRQLSARVREHKGAARWQDESFRPAIHSIGIELPSLEKEPTGIHKAGSTISTCVHHCVTLNPGYRARRDAWWRRRHAQPQPIEIRIPTLRPTAPYAYLHSFDKHNISPISRVYSYFHPF